MKRFLSLLLTVVLVVSLVPTTALATTDTANEPLTSTVYVTTDTNTCVRVVDATDTVVSDEIDVIAGKRSEIATLEVGVYTLEYQGLGGGVLP